MQTNQTIEDGFGPRPWRIRKARYEDVWILLLWDKMYEFYAFWRAFKTWEEVINYLDRGFSRRAASGPTTAGLPTERFFP